MKVRAIKRAELKAEGESSRHLMVSIARWRVNTFSNAIFCSRQHLPTLRCKRNITAFSLSPVVGANKKVTLTKKPRATIGLSRKRAAKVNWEK